MKVCFFDTETGGLLPEHPTIQLAAIAIDTETWKEEEVFERKIAFDVAKADPEALKINHFDPAAWEKAPTEFQTVLSFGAFLKRHAGVTLTSKRTGNPYRVARLGGHNVVGFDLKRVEAMFKRHGEFFPIQFNTVLDTLHGAVWFFEGKEEQPKDFKLVSLAKHFGIEVEGAHDALFDVRLSIGVAQYILGAKK